MSARSPLAALVLAQALARGHDERPRRRLLPGVLGRHLRRRPRSVFLAEHYLAGASAERLDALACRLERAAAEGSDVRFLGFAALPGDEAFLCVLAAPSAEAAARAVEGADRVVPAIWRSGRT